MTEWAPTAAAIAEARSEDAPAIAAIHLTARRQAMPYLNLAHTDDETRDYFAQSWEIVRWLGGSCAIRVRLWPTC